MTIKPILTAEQYVIERAICDKAYVYVTSIMTANKRNYLTREETQHPDYVACNNTMRGRVEQYELLIDTPDKFVAYVGKSDNRFTITTWTGDMLGTATLSNGWCVGNRGERIHQCYARINGREFTGRTQGDGMYVLLRETAKSKRDRAVNK